MRKNKKLWVDFKELWAKASGRKMHRNWKMFNTAVLIIYLTVVCSIHIYITCRTKYADLSVVCVLILASLSVALVICPYALKHLSRMEIARGGDCNGSMKERKKDCEDRHVSAGWYGCYWAVSFAVLIVYFFAYYPGGFSYDSIEQYAQALTGEYSDWHPVIHTLLIFTFPLKMTGQPGFIVFFQIIYFASVFAYMAYTFRQYGNGVYAACSLGFILLNPNTGNIAVRPWKDAIFAAASLLLMVYAARIYMTCGKWLQSKRHVLMFAAAGAVTTLVRHNAVLFTIPLLCAIYFYCSRKRWRQTAALLLAFCFFIKVPVYYMLQVDSPGNRKTEVMGIPLTIIGNAVKESHEVLDRQTMEFAYKIASYEDWENFYQCGSFNDLKFHGIHTDVIEETSIIEILKMTYQCLARAPGASFMAFFTLTSMVYGIEGAGDCVTYGMEENEYGLVYTGNQWLYILLENYRQLVVGSIFKYLFQYAGIMNLVMLACILSKSNLTKREHWRRMLLCVPILAYNFGTMLLLTGRDFRFFYVNFLICPVVVFLMQAERGRV